MLKRRRHTQSEYAVIGENVENMKAAGMIEEYNGAKGISQKEEWRGLLLRQLSSFDMILLEMMPSHCRESMKP